MKVGARLVIGVLAVSLATGCGGDDSSSTTEWAEDVCSSITTWTNSISTAVDSLRGGNVTEESLSGVVDEVESATNDFVDDLRGLERPDTDAGEQAQESLDQLADDIEENFSNIEEALDDASGASGTLEAISVVTATLSTMGTQLSSTFAALEQLDAGGELEQAFEDADSCEELESG